MRRCLFDHGADELTLQESFMSTFTKYHGDFFYRALAAVLMIGPVLLIIAAGTMPDDPRTGKLMVYGHGAILAVVAGAMVLRAVYARGFVDAWKIAASEPGYSLTA
jgi:hypothetical protein